MARVGNRRGAANILKAAVWRSKVPLAVIGIIWLDRRCLPSSLLSRVYVIGPLVNCFGNKALGFIAASVVGFRVWQEVEWLELCGTQLTQFSQYVEKQNQSGLHSFDYQSKLLFLQSEKNGKEFLDQLRALDSGISDEQFKIEMKAFSKKIKKTLEESDYAKHLPEKRKELANTMRNSVQNKLKVNTLLTDAQKKQWLAAFDRAIAEDLY